MVYKLHLTESEFRDLALVVYLGDWMANAQAVPGEESHPGISAILQKVYKVAKENSVPGLKIKQDGEKYYCMEHDELAVGGPYDIIKYYDEQSMFETLADRLASRDVHEKLVHGKKPAAAEDVANGIGLETAAYDDYMDEFAMHGIGRVVVDRKRDVPCEADESQ